MVDKRDEIDVDQELQLKLESWRSADLDDRIKFLGWLDVEYAKRQHHGLDKYGIIFQGNPIQQGIEENLDQLFYLYWAQRQLDFVEGQRDNLRHLLEAVMEFGLTEQVAIDIQGALDG